VLDVTPPYEAGRLEAITAASKHRAHDVVETFAPPTDEI
jgi:hypothetical protein